MAHLIKGCEDPHLQLLTAQWVTDLVQACTSPLIRTDLPLFGPLAEIIGWDCPANSQVLSMEVEKGYGMQ